MSLINKKLALAARPDRFIKNSDFKLVEEELREIKQGEFLIQTHYLSLAPVMKFYMIDGAGIENPLQIGDTMRGRGVGQIIKSRHPDYKEGEFVQGKFGWQEYVISSAAPYDMMYKLNHSNLPVSLSLGVLGITGFTAYFGLTRIGKLKKDETIVISSAGGGVGTIAGQLASIMGAHVTGLTSSDEKCNFLKSELGFHNAVNYSKEKINESIHKYHPHGIDVFFDNAGGWILDEVLPNIRRYARVICCGRISAYAKESNQQEYNLKNWHHIYSKRSSMQSFFIYDYKNDYKEAEEKISSWIEEGKLKYKEDILHGLEKMPEALNRLFERKNQGKQLVKVI